jgi:serine/threonine protein kinase
MANLFFDF